MDTSVWLLIAVCGCVVVVCRQSWSFEVVVSSSFMIIIDESLLLLLLQLAIDCIFDVVSVNRVPMINVLTHESIFLFTTHIML